MCVVDWIGFLAFFCDDFFYFYFYFLAPLKRTRSLLQNLSRTGSFPHCCSSVERRNKVAPLTRVAFPPFTF